MNPLFNKEIEINGKKFIIKSDEQIDKRDLEELENIFKDNNKDTLQVVIEAILSLIKEKKELKKKVQDCIEALQDINFKVEKISEI